MSRFSPYQILLLSIVGTFMAVLCQAQGVAFMAQGNQLFDNTEVRPIVSSHYFQNQLLCDSTYIFHRDFSKDVDFWNLSEKAVYRYDHFGQVTQRINSTPGVGGNWFPKDLFSYSYNLSNELILTVRDGWDSTSGSWSKKRRNHFHYNYRGDESEVLTESWKTDRWEYHKRIVKQYNDSRNLTIEQRSDWSVQVAAWIPQARRLYVYDDNDLLLEETVQTWNPDSTAWENLSRRSFHYDENDNLIESIESAWSNDGQHFVPEAITQWEYTLEGQPQATELIALGGKDLTGYTTLQSLYNPDGTLDQKILQRWNAETQTWEPFTYEEHYWSRHFIGNPDANEGEIHCLYGNPHEPGSPIFCESLKLDVPYTAELFNLMGQKYFSRFFESGHIFRIDRSVPPGFYLLVVSGGLDVHTQKIIVR